MILSYTGCTADEACVFGDRLYTDIALGRNSGIYSVLVLSGETKLRDVDNCPEEQKPDLIIDSIKNLL